MDVVDVTKMSSKGQIVIPQEVRATLGLESGTRFVVFGQGDTIYLKRIGRPTREEGRRLLEDSQKLARRAGLTKSDLKRSIAKARRTP